MLQCDYVSIGRCVSCLVTLKINHLATHSRCINLFFSSAFQEQIAQKANDCWVKFEQEKKWDGENRVIPSLPFRFPTNPKGKIMPITQHHAAFLRPMTVSCGRIRFGKRGGAVFTEHLLCARPCAYFCFCSLLKGIRPWADGPWAILPLGSYFFGLHTLHCSLIIPFSMMKKSWC